MKNDAIELKGLSKNYGNHTVVDKLDLNIRKGEVFGLLGPNGAGKSTTILMMLGLTEPTSGTVKVCGIDSTRDPVEVKRKVGYLPENLGFYEDRTGLENLVYTAKLNQIHSDQAQQRALQMLKRVGLAEAGEKKVGKYSRGMRQRLGLADVLIKSPEVIILDEPTLGIDPKGVQELLKLIAQLSKEDKLTVLLSSHHLHQVQQVCDRVGLFVDGRLIAEGDIETLSSQLFGGQPLTVEMAVSLKGSGSDLRKTIGKMKGVDRIREEDGSYIIDCSQDVTHELAQKAIKSGAILNHLSKKKFGLDFRVINNPK